MRANSILEAVGRTPLVRLNRIPNPNGAAIWGKAEFMSPGGSVKDRIGVQMALAAEKSGDLKPGGTIIEPTAGNTGVGLAIFAAVRGYQAIFVMPEKMSQEKIDLLKAYGARIELTPTVDAGDPDSYQNVAKRMAQEIPGAFMPNQFHNPHNPEAHYQTTGPEIWEQTEGKIDAFVAGIGTGGTISGVAKFLREKKPDILIVGADPEGSIYSGGYPGSYKVEGIGMSYIPSSFDFKTVDRYESISDKESFTMARRLAREEGILAGGSSGTACEAAYRVAAEMRPDQNVVFVLCDTGRNYLSKIFNDEWMIANGFLDSDKPRDTVEKVLAQKSRPQEMFFVSPDTLIEDVVKMMDEHSVSQVPVMEKGRIVGSLQDSTVMQALYRNPSLAQQSARGIMSRSMPILPLSTDLDEVYLEFSAGRPGIMVKDDKGKLCGIITRMDVIDYLASKVKEPKV